MSAGLGLNQNTDADMSNISLWVESSVPSGTKRQQTPVHLLGWKKKEQLLEVVTELTLEKSRVE